MKPFKTYTLELFNCPACHSTGALRSVSFKSLFECSSFFSIDFRLNALTYLLIFSFCLLPVRGEVVNHGTSGVFKGLSHSAPRCQGGFLFGVHESRFA